MHDAGLIFIAILAVLFGGPALLGLAGLLRARGPGDPSGPALEPWRWAVSVQSCLLYVIAFNLTFFFQELFLVLPKALTPGLEPVLCHNNHSWRGDHPLENLFQGTGAAAILLSGLAFAWLAKRGSARSGAAGLFCFWMAYHGLFQALPQFVIGAFEPGSDVGRAMNYFALGRAAKMTIAAAALTAIVLAGLWLTRPLLALAASAAQIATARARARFVLLFATMPALAAIPLIIAYRVPREWGEVVMPPVAVTLIGILWLQANAWRVRDAGPALRPPNGAILIPLALAAVLLAVFQLVLRPGIPF